eukprot:1158867-Pelagomonas_calceolata.AAC.31
MYEQHCLSKHACACAKTFWQYMCVPKCLGESGGGGGAGEGSNSSVAAVVADILARLPADFDLEVAQQKFPVSYHQSMNQVGVAGVRSAACCVIVRPAFSESKEVVSMSFDKAKGVPR